MLAAVALQSATAATVNMNADDAVNTSSFNSALHWADGFAPSAANDYQNNNFLLRTPGDATTAYTFGGASLLITSANATLGGDLNDALIFKGTLSGNTTITINNLTVNGGALRNGSGDANSFTLAGSSLTVGSLGMAVHVQGPLFSTSPVGGSGEIRIMANGSASAARVYHFANSANTFNGSINLVNATQSRFALDSGANLNFVIGAAGVNNKVFGAGVAAFNGLFNLDLSGASAGLGDTWTLVDNNTLAESFGATFSVAGFTDLGGDLWQTSANGVGYQFSEVTGVLSVVPVPEPSSMAFLLGGVVALIRRRRKQA